MSQAALNYEVLIKPELDDDPNPQMVRDDMQFKIEDGGGDPTDFIGQPNPQALEILLKKDLGINTQELEDLMDDFDIDYLMNIKKPLEELNQRVSVVGTDQKRETLQTTDDFDDFDSDEDYIHEGGPDNIVDQQMEAPQLYKPIHFLEEPGDIKDEYVHGVNTDLDQFLLSERISHPPFHIQPMHPYSHLLPGEIQGVLTSSRRSTAKKCAIR